jgi:hypothetical protein
LGACAKKKKLRERSDMDKQKPNNLHLGYHLEKVVPELAEWNYGNGIDIVSWINGLGNFEHGIAYGRMFWQDFVEHDGCVLHAGFSESNYSGFMKQLDGDREAVERVMNHCHISDYFPNQQPTKDQIIYFGRLLKEIWQVKLKNDFPARNIQVEFYEQDSDSLDDYEITVFQPRTEKTNVLLE